jgi:hypothetical protein
MTKTGMRGCLTVTERMTGTGTESVTVTVTTTVKGTESMFSSVKCSKH